MGEYKISYKEAGKKRVFDESYRRFLPTRIFITLFAILFFGCSFLSMMNISFTSLFSMDNATIEIGFPFTFLKMEGIIGSNSFLVGGLIINLLIYAIVSYVINILINLIKGSLEKNPDEFAKEIKVSKKMSR